MKRITYKIFAIVALTSFLASCTEVIDLDLDDEYKKLVVEAYLTTDTIAHEVVLCTSTSYFANEQPEFIENANVYITNLDVSKTFQLSESSTDPGHYFTESTVYGEIGETYTLHIEDVDVNKDGNVEDYLSTTKLKPVILMDSINAIYDNVFGELGYRVFGNGQELPTPGDYYMWRYYINDVLVNDTLYEIVFNDDGLINGLYLSNLEMGFITDAQSGDTLKVESQSITKDYYEFVISFMLETQWSAGPFGGPPANIKTNISNGGLGYFKASAVDYIEIVLP